MIRQAVSNWENEKTEPNIETLHKIADVLEVSIEELIYGSKRESTIVHNHYTTQEIKKQYQMEYHSVRYLRW